VCVCVYVCVYAYIHIHIYTYTHTYKLTSVCVYASVCLCVCSCMCVCMYVCVCKRRSMNPDQFIGLNVPAVFLYKQNLEDINSNPSEKECLASESEGKDSKFPSSMNESSYPKDMGQEWFFLFQMI